MASLFSRPDLEIIENILEDRALLVLKEYVEAWGGDDQLLTGFLFTDPPEKIFKDLSAEYHRLFEEEGGKKISLVESFYKPWTQDPLCPLPFAKEKGYLMGDSALHLMALYQHCGLEVSNPFQGMPDHLVLELEFLSFLYSHGTDQEIHYVIRDHFDWIPLLKEECEKANAHPFYLKNIEILQLFLKAEMERLESQNHGKKEIHSKIP